ncbi:MAG: DUF1015 family protein [Bacteroidota bacterium]
MELRPFAAVLARKGALEKHPDFTAIARDRFRQLLEEGCYTLQNRSAFYLLRLNRESESEQLGFIGLLPSAAYEAGLILPHEATLVKGHKKQSRVLRNQRAMTKPVLLTYPQVDSLQLLLEKAVVDAEPLLQFEQYGFHFEYLRMLPHWEEELLQAWQEAQLQPIVADGHHRLASALAMSKDEEQPVLDFFPALLLPGVALELNTFFRLISPAGDQSPAELLDDLEAYFSIRTADTPFFPQQSGEWALAIEGQFYRLNRRPVKALAEVVDPIWFNDYILPRQFNIHDSREDPRIFSREMGPKGPTFEHLARKYTDHAIFAGYPISGTDFFNIVRQRQLLPPKSTCFYPRIPSGLLAYTWE